MRELGISKEQVLVIIQKAPVLLIADTHVNLRPTLKFFVEEMGASSDDVVEAVLANPKVLIYSLEKRWKPRVAAMRDLGVTPIFKQHWRPVANRTPAKFSEWLGNLL